MCQTNSRSKRFTARSQERKAAVRMIDFSRKSDERASPAEREKAHSAGKAVGYDHGQSACAPSGNARSLYGRTKAVIACVCILSQPLYVLSRKVMKAMKQRSLSKSPGSCRESPFSLVLWLYSYRPASPAGGAFPALTELSIHGGTARHGCLRPWR